MAKKSGKLLLIGSALTVAAGAVAWALRKSQRGGGNMYRVEIPAVNKKGKAVCKAAVTEFITKLGCESNFAIAGGVPKVTKDGRLIYTLISSDAIPLGEISEKLMTEFSLASCNCKWQK